MTTPAATHQHPDRSEAEQYEAPAWEERYAGDATMWSGNPNAQLVAEVAGLTPGTALDVGCGEGGDVIWLARQGWRVTGADFAANGLARASRHVAAATMTDRVEWWQVDARRFDPQGRAWDLVTTHFLHPGESLITDVVGRLATAVAPGGHLLVVGHSPTKMPFAPDDSRRRAMWTAEQAQAGLPAGFATLVVEQRPRTAVRDGVSHEIDDAVLLARRDG